MERGFRRANYRLHRQPVYYDGNVCKTLDVDAHNGEAFKMARAVRDLGSRRAGMDTYDETLNRVGD